MFKLKISKQANGFTLIEVLFAILIATIFLTAAMQMIVIAAAFKVHAQENTEATAWIQEDLEAVKYEAGKMSFPIRTTLTADAMAKTTSISVDSVSNLAVNDTLKIGLDPGNYKITSISGATVNFNPKLATTQVSNAIIAEATACSASRTDALADALRDRVIAASSQASNSVDSTKIFRTGQTFSMRKTATLSTNAPYNVLELKYEVSPGSTFDSTTAIAKFDTEVIPNVAFQCQ